jgi:hypothetical protein
MSIFRSSSLTSDIAKYKLIIPEAPVLDDAGMALAFNQIGLLEDQVYIARAQQEMAAGKDAESKSVSRLLMLQLQLAHAAAYAYKMSAIKSLSLAKEQSDLFHVDSCWKVWQRAEHMIKAVDAEIRVRDALGRQH